MPVVSLSSTCRFHERRVSNFSLRKVGSSLFLGVLSPSFIVNLSLEVEREKTVACAVISLV